MEETLYSTTSSFTLDFIESQKLSISKSTTRIKEKPSLQKCRKLQSLLCRWQNLTENKNNYSLKLQGKKQCAVKYYLATCENKGKIKYFISPALNSEQCPTRK